MKKHTRQFVYLFIIGVLLFGFIGVVFAQSQPKEEINEMNEKIAEKKASIDHINRKIEEYRKEIARKEKRTASLQEELDLLENRIEKTNLDIRATQEEIEAVNSEIEVLNGEIGQLQSKVTTNQQALRNILRRINVNDDVLPMEVLFGSDSFSELFDQLQYLENVNGDLKKTLANMKESHQALQQTKVSFKGKQSRLTNLQSALSENKEQLEEKAGAKDSLLAQTQKSEAQYRTLLNELREEQAYINQQIGALQGEIEEKLAARDEVGQGSDLMTWPVDPGYRGISTYFHDPTYPFRHLFEHSGLDIPQRQGTAVKSAAPGYVAWTRTGRLYGNYVMVIHSDGMATLYAHLSQINVAPDDFVGRGETIALSGGMPGTPGAGLSTGPHLHFEIRKDGIPVNPMNYLVDTEF